MDQRGTREVVRGPDRPERISQAKRGRMMVKAVEMIRYPWIQDTFWISAASQGSDTPYCFKQLKEKTKYIK